MYRFCPFSAFEIFVFALNYVHTHVIVMKTSSEFYYKIILDLAMCKCVITHGFEIAKWFPLNPLINEEILTDFGMMIVYFLMLYILFMIYIYIFAALYSSEKVARFSFSLLWSYAADESLSSDRSFFHDEIDVF